MLSPCVCLGKVTYFSLNISSLRLSLSFSSSLLCWRQKGKHLLKITKTLSQSDTNTSENNFKQPMWRMKVYSMLLCVVAHLYYMHAAHCSVSITFSNCFCCVETEERVLSSSDTLCFVACRRLFNSSVSATHTYRHRQTKRHTCTNC